MLSLYRRHRPRTFNEVVGQEHIVRTLRNAIELGKVHHAYLFVGSRGTGKTSMAKLLACALNAQGGPVADFPPDDPACRAIAAGTSLDVVEMDAASNNSVDDVRELRENVALQPMAGGRRVYILDEAHMLSTSAWNAFLKTLEEPPPHVVFVLATTEAHKVPPTIVDRCHRFDFHRPSLEQLAGVVRRVAAEEEIEVPDAAIGMIARAATGSFRDALGTLEQLVTYGGSRIELADVLDVLGVADAELVLEAAEAVADHDSRAALLCVDRLAASGRDVAQFTRDLAAHLRHVFVTQTLGEVPESFSVTAEHTDRIQSQAERVSEGELLRAVEQLSGALTAIKDGADPRIQLELALTKAARPEADLRFEALAFRIEQLERRLAAIGQGQAATPVPSERSSEGDASAPAGNVAAGAGGIERSSPSAAGPATERTRTANGTGSSPTPTPITGRGSVAVEAAGPVTASAHVEAAIQPDTAPHRHAHAPAHVAAQPAPAAPRSAAAPPDPASGTGGPALDLTSLRALWPSVVDAVRAENAMVGALLGEGRPAALEGERLTVALPPGAEFTRRKLIANGALAQTTLHRLTGRSLAVRFELGEGHSDHGGQAPRSEPVLSEEELLERLKQEFGARELFDDETPAEE